MGSRCKICGTPVSHLDICNHCRTVREERRFFKMVNREELKETQLINSGSEPVAPPKDITAR
ncbi:MAG: hypothetical protein HKP58_18700 [Desulfatitalea sp.]|nr:hypothetical protein [Desulfatitalea sp.]NNK02446.1 hypothetical protein [Desulfatitalea sp.]